MDTFLQVTLSGVTMGCIYAFVALGFAPVSTHLAYKSETADTAG